MVPNRKDSLNKLIKKIQWPTTIRKNSFSTLRTKVVKRKTLWPSSRLVLIISKLWETRVLIISEGTVLTQHLSRISSSSQNLSELSEKLALSNQV